MVGYWKQVEYHLPETRKSILLEYNELHFYEYNRLSIFNNSKNNIIMAWKSTTVSQPGNSVRTWIIVDYPHSDVTSHDAIVLKNDGDLNVRTWIERIELVENTFGYTQYNIRVRTAGTGSDSVSFRFFAESMN